MGFKRNITITVACIITECLISLIPVVFMIYIFFSIDKIGEIFSTLLIIPFLILIINLLLIIISLIAQIFIKTEYCLKKEFLVIKTQNSVQEIKYTDITSIAYDFGNLTRFNTRQSQLVLFGKQCQQLVSIYNPSIRMVHIIKTKCKNAKTEHYHNKRFLWLFSIINGAFLLFSVVAKLLF